MITDKYAKCNLEKLLDDFPLLRERINLRLTTPSEDSYFTTLLNVI